MRCRLNLALQVSQGSASTCFRWSGQFRYSFVEGLFRDSSSNFYWNRFIFDREGAKYKLAQLFWDTVHSVNSISSLIACYLVGLDYGAVFRALSEYF